MSWIVAHAAAITAVCGALASLLATVKQLLDGKPRAERWIDVVIDVLSWVPRAGHVGLLGPLNVPGFPSIAKPVDSKLQLLIPFIALASLLTGCAAVKKVIVDAGVCASPAVVAEVANLLPAVTAILTGGAADWQAQLAALETVGVQFVVCAVEQAIHDLAARQGPAINTDRGLAIARGRLYLSYYGVK